MYKKFMENGRSMIEMLGVLAIIAVLSVGGIAGYSKAMEKYKINKLITDYNNLIFGLLEYRQNLQEQLKGQVFLSDMLISLNLIPNTWQKISSQYMQDNYGNFIGTFYREYSNAYGYASPEESGIIIDFIFGGLTENDKGEKIAANFNGNLCFEVLDKIAVPLHYTIRGILMPGGNGYYYGDTFCRTGRPCLNTMTLSKMKSMCSSCDKTKRCALTIIL